MKRLLLLLVAALALSACSNRPGTDQIRTQVEARLLANGRDRIYSVENFRKVNGIPRDKNTYIAEVTYDLRFKHNLKETASILQGDSGSIFAAGMDTAALAMKYGDFKAGDVRHEKGSFRFIRTEKGWRLESAQEKG